MLPKVILYPGDEEVLTEPVNSHPAIPDRKFRSFKTWLAYLAGQFVTFLTVFGVSPASSCQCAPARAIFFAVRGFHWTKLLTLAAAFILVYCPCIYSTAPDCLVVSCLPPLK